MMSPEQHEEHMGKVEQGLQAIMQSQDINEIHQIAQALLGEEKQEQAAEGAPQDPRAQLMAAVESQQQ